MHKSELIDAIASHANLNKADAGRALDGILSAIQNALKNGDTPGLQQLIQQASEVRSAWSLQASDAGQNAPDT